MPDLGPHTLGARSACGGSGTQQVRGQRMDVDTLLAAVFGFVAGLLAFPFALWGFQRIFADPTDHEPRGGAK